MIPFTPANLLAASALEVIAERRAAGADHLMWEARGRYAEALRTAAVWVRDRNTVFVSVPTNPSMAGDILDAAANRVPGEVLPAAHIFTEESGARMTLRCACVVQH